MNEEKREELPVAGEGSLSTASPQLSRTQVVAIIGFLLAVLLALGFIGSAVANGSLSLFFSAASSTSSLSPGLMATTTYSVADVLGSPPTFHPLLTPVQRAAVLATTTPGFFLPVKDQYSLFVSAPENTPATSTSFEAEAFSLYSTQYVDDGVISSGAYQGYRRVIAEVGISDSISGSIAYFTFATKNGKTFILHADNNGLVPNPALFNTAVVVGAAPFPEHFPKMIPFGKYTLVRGDGGGPSAWFSTVSALSTSTEASSSVELPSPVPGLRFFAEPAAASLGYYLNPQFNSPIDIARAEDMIQKYIQSNSQVTVRDGTGLGMTYAISFATFADQQSATDQYYPPAGGNYPQNYGYLEVHVQNQGYYSTYGDLLSFGCMDFSYNTYVLKNISSADLTDTGISWQGVELYALVPTHPVVSFLYQLKRGLTTVPLAAYAAKHPILVFKGPWGRWIAVGEQIFYAEGCGKPVIYLYPPKPTSVSVQFAKPPQFSVQIPNYVNGWHVLAEPNGTLHDEQPQYTDCSAIDSSRFGSGYAIQACKTNTYPYLYWAGIANGQYPVPTGGWIVPQANLSAFLQSKLKLIGLTQQERSDMLSFWGPELLKAQAPYYRISFFDTAQMNQFIPMYITPRPTSVLRVFLDWTPLAQLPAHPPVPQTLTPFTRSGFTVVEWGGLER